MTQQSGMGSTVPPPPQQAIPCGGPIPTAVHGTPHPLCCSPSPETDESPGTGRRGHHLHHPRWLHHLPWAAAPANYVGSSSKKSEAPSPFATGLGSVHRLSSLCLGMGVVGAQVGVRPRLSLCECQWEGGFVTLHRKNRRPYWTWHPGRLGSRWRAKAHTASLPGMGLPLPSGGVLH